MRCLWISGIFFILFMHAGAYAGNLLEILPDENWMTQDYLSEINTDSMPAQPDSIALAKRKSGFKAFFMSAAVPGMGELYAGKKIGLLNTALEVGLWVGFVSYENQADDKRDEYESHADEYWDFQRWEVWYDNSPWYENGSETFVRDEDDNPVKDHHYYEKLGKYSWAQGGWDDFKDEYQVDFQVVQLSGHHSQYLDMRQRKNDLNNRASLCASAAILNHIVSGFHAAILTRSFNKKLSEFTGGTKLKFAAAETSNGLEYQILLTKAF
ncbi:MAG: hypothetical protein B6244_02330 [Candidatus Cloacimonetes bacterium 4572_55]|nr:MAG: hypothetical protein B6244_02330 [Candidatus Cloacimonetes bacterium 4572_55]